MAEARFQAALSDAPADWQAWALAELASAPRPTRIEGAGQVFTPAGLADQLVAVAGLAAGLGALPVPRVLDPACGDGALLVAAGRALLGAGHPVREVLAALEGWDIDPAAVRASKLALLSWALGVASGEAPLVPLAIRCQDALLAEVGQGVGAVVTNPPYLEAKRFRAVDPGLRERLRERVPELRGAVDLYAVFAWLTLDWLAPGGRAALLVPDKVCAARYARPLRERWLQSGSVTHLLDLSRARPRPFPGTGVYPVIIGVSPSLTSGVVRVAHGFEASDTVAPVWRDVPAALMHDPSGDWPIFVPFETWPALRALLLGPRLQAVAEVRSTCSFHQRGLRERFVHATRPAEVDGVPVLPYLGGPSRATMTEISAYQERWAGWWIRYDANALTREHRNPLPPLAETFQREKVLLCQHGVRLRPYVDAEGRFVSKDVYPVAFPRAGGNVWALGAVLGSTVFTALYNTLFQGLLCGGETYHYLPALLAQVPVPPQEAWDAEGWERAVRALQVQGGPDPELWDALDRSVTEAYGLDPAILPGLRAVHLRRVGAECPSDGAC